MDCQKFEKHVAAFMEGLTDRNLAQAMQEHRSACGQCARLAELHESILAALESTEPVAAPEGLTDRILAAVQVEEARVEELNRQGLWAQLADWVTEIFPSRKSFAAGFVAGSSVVAMAFTLALMFINRLAPTTTVAENTAATVESGAGTLYGAVNQKIVGLPAVAQWLASLQENLGFFFQPIQIPYFPFPVPAYLIAAVFAALIVGVISWLRFRSPLMPAAVHSRH